MNDLIYDIEYIDEIKNLFPDAKIEDASDEIHNDRILIEININEKEYFRKIILNGFGPVSLGALLLDKEIVNGWIKEWKKDYPEYFKRESTK